MPRFRFENFTFDTDRLELRKSGEPVSVQPAVLRLLELLIECGGNLVSRDELVDRLWEGRIVSDDAINKRVALLRRALDDTGKPRRLIRSVYGEGISFIGELADMDAPAPARPASKVAAVSGADDDGGQTAGGRQPKIAVLPFRLVGLAGPFGAIAEGLPDDITSVLVKLKSLKVISRASAFRYASGMSPMSQIRRDLGVGYAISGTIDLSNNRMAVYAELIRTSDEAIVWSETYRAPLEQVHEVRDDIVGRIANTVEMEVPRAEASRLGLVMPANVGAWDAYHLGQASGVDALHPDYSLAEDHFRHAVGMEPEFARARASLAFMHFNRFTADIDRERHAGLMVREAEQAIRLEPSDPLTNLAYGAIVAGLGQHDTAIEHVRRAVALAPSFARAHATYGALQTATGKVRESLASIERAVALSPRDPHMPTWLAIRLVDLAMLGKPDKVRGVADDLAALDSKQIIPLGWALTGYSVAGDQEAAQGMAEKIRKLLPRDKPKGIPGVYRGLPPALQAMLRNSFTQYDLIA